MKETWILRFKIERKRDFLFPDCEGNEDAMYDIVIETCILYFELERKGSSVFHDLRAHTSHVIHAEGNDEGCCRKVPLF